MQSATQTFSSEGVEIAFYEEGSGSPIVLVHGFASSALANWYEPLWVKTLVEAGYRVISFDHRGHGRSEKLYESELYRAPQMAKDAANLITHLDLPPVPVMGYSMGARVTALLAIQAGHLVHTAILAGLAENMINGVGGEPEIAAGLRAPSLDHVSDPQARAFRIFAERTGGDLEALASCIMASRQKISTDELSAIACPVLVAAGTEDDVAGAIEPLAEALSNGEALPIPGRDHMRAVGDKVFKAGVLRFLEKHGSR
ncbi:MAG: alpha/beta hydrolase [Pseudomonadota bacterium]